MSLNIEIKPLQKYQVQALENLPPKEWNFNIIEFLNKFYEKEYFHAVIAINKNQIIGCGNILLTGNSSWLGNIIVDSNYRRNHIGKNITEYLINYSYKMKCETINLIATEIGQLLYSTLGFKNISEYKFYKDGINQNIYNDTNIHIINNNDLESIIKIDKYITGEDRSYIYQNNNDFGYVYKSNNEIIGFYYPNIGNGVIIALDKKAGVSLLSFKHMKENIFSVLPKENIEAVQYLKLNGFNEYFSAVRMRLGKELPWNPEGIFCRIAGWIG
jgi:predicted GNAT family N-acyltransferase